MTGQHITTHRRLPSKSVAVDGSGNAEYRGSRGRIANSIAWWPPLETPKAPTRSGLLRNSTARVLSQRIAYLMSAGEAGYPASGGIRKSNAATTTPLLASGSLMIASLRRSPLHQAPPWISHTKGNGPVPRGLKRRVSSGLSPEIFDVFDVKIKSLWWVGCHNFLLR